MPDNMKRSHKYLWVQKRDYTESNVLVVNERILREGDDDYPAEYNHFYSLLTSLKRVYEKDGLIVSSGLKAMAISGNYNELDEDERMIPYTYYNDSGENVVPSLQTVSSRLGYSIPTTDIEQFQKAITLQKERKKKVMVCSIAAAIILVGTLFIIFK